MARHLRNPENRRGKRVGGRAAGEGCAGQCCGPHECPCPNDASVGLPACCCEAGPDSCAGSMQCVEPCSGENEPPVVSDNCVGCCTSEIRVESTPRVISVVMSAFRITAILGGPCDMGPGIPQRYTTANAGGTTIHSCLPPGGDFEPPNSSISGTRTISGVFPPENDPFNNCPPSTTAIDECRYRCSGGGILCNLEVGGICWNESTHGLSFSGSSSTGRMAGAVTGWTPCVENAAL